MSALYCVAGVGVTILLFGAAFALATLADATETSDGDK